MPLGRVRISATRSEIFWPSSMPPPPGLAPCPTTTSMASAACAGRPGSCRSGTAGTDRPSCLEWPRSSGVMPPSPVVVEVPASVGAAAQRFLGVPEREPKLMPAMVIGIFSSSGFLAKRVAQHHVGIAAFPVALQRIARHRGAEKQQIVEMWEPAFGAEPPDIVEARAGRRARISATGCNPVEAMADSRGPSRSSGDVSGPHRSPHGLNMHPHCRRLEVVQLAGRAVAPKVGGVGVDPGALVTARQRRQVLLGASCPFRCSRRPGSRPCRARYSLAS